MRIALVSPYDFAVPGGANNHIRHLAREFLELGHEAKIVAPSSHPKIAEDNLIVIDRRPMGLPAGGSVAHVALSPLLGSRVRRLIAEEQFSVIHLHEPFMPYLPVQFLRFSTNAVTIGTFHAVKDRGNKLYALAKPLVGSYIARLDGRTAVSPVAIGLIARYFPGEYEIIPNGIEYEHFAEPLPPPRELVDDRPTVLFVGRQEKRKGLQYLLEAYAQIKPQIPEVRLVIVGPDGGMRQGNLRFINNMRLRDVTFADFVSYEDLPRYYQRADVFCAPNLGNESFGIILLEAMAAGTPVVASSIAAFSALVKEGEDGILVPPRDSGTLAAALLNLLGNPERRQTMKHVAQAKAQAYDWGIVARQTLAYYKRVADERGKARC
jgi:phosphatidylinositol alpha-mannosyltransferase